MRRKQNLASAFGIKKKVGSNNEFFRDDVKSFKFEKTPYTALYFTAF